MDKIYRIIWADDEIDALFDEQGKDLLSRLHFDVIKCNNAAMLEEKLKNVSYRIDAVIVDAHFTAKGFIPSREEEVSGLRRAISLIREYRHLPFYLYTQLVNLSDLFDEGELDYFKDNDAIFFKSDNNGLLSLLNRIKNDVDNRNNVGFQIDNQFREELNYFHLFDKQCKAQSYYLIRDLLIQIREGSINNKESYFNRFRTEIFDNMNVLAARMGIVPKQLSLNDFSRFICSKTEMYNLNEEVLPKALHMLMEYVVRMVQDGSHKGPDLQYEVNQYVSENKDTLIMHSLLFAVIEVVSWFIPYLEKHTDKQQNMTNWQIQDNTGASISEEGVIERDEKGYYHIGTEYSVLLKNITLVGKKVKITNFKQNTNSSTKEYYSFFVREEDFQLIDP